MNRLCNITKRSRRHLVKVKLSSDRVDIPGTSVDISYIPNGDNWVLEEGTTFQENVTLSERVSWRVCFVTRCILDPHVSVMRHASCVMVAEATSWEWTGFLVVVFSWELLHMQTISNFTANDIQFGAGYCLPRYIPTHVGLSTRKSDSQEALNLLVTVERYWALFYMPLYTCIHVFTQFAECTGTDYKLKKQHKLSHELSLSWRRWL
jgi:hypothetical protein